MSGQADQVRARFTVREKTETEGWDEENPILYTIVAEAVTDQLDAETAAFFAATPAGKVELGTVVEDAAKLFVPGRDVYVTFTPVDP